MSAKWKDVLQPFAEEYAEMVTTWEDRIKAMSDDELAYLRFSVKQPSQTNCWWATGHAAPLIARFAQEDDYRRKCAAEREATSERT